MMDTRTWESQNHRLVHAHEPGKMLKQVNGSTAREIGHAVTRCGQVSRIPDRNASANDSPAPRRRRAGWTGL